jgi:hypothetical protein
MIGAILAGAQAAYGVYNTIKAGKEAKDYQKQMESMARKSPLMKESPELASYYQQALNRSNENPYQSQQYQLGAMNVRRGTAQGLSAMQDRRSSGDISRLALGQQSALQNLGMQAESQRNQRFGQLGGAVQMRRSERDQMFDINQMTPYNRLLQLQQLKTQAANDRFNAGLSTTAQGLGNFAQLSIADKMYNPKLKTQEVPITQAASNLASRQAFDQTRMDLPGLSGYGGLGVPRTPALKPRQPFLYGITD